MKTVVTAQVGADGVLTLALPLGKGDANKTVRVTVEPVEESAGPSAPIADRESWLRFLERTAGSITDPTFQRHPQGEYEQREPLP
jgi:hypothetical protein